MVQSRDISETQLSSLFWLNIVLCVILAIILVAISPLVGMFYGNPAGGTLVAASSLLVLATAPNPLLGAMLNRAMRFHAQSIVEIFGALVMLGATIGAAILHKSYWALLIGGVAATIANTLAFVYFLRWRPRGTRRSSIPGWPTDG